MGKLIGLYLAHCFSILDLTRPVFVFNVLSVDDPCKFLCFQLSTNGYRLDVNL